ncbi:hypothetical protein ACFWBF_36605 [Streptomyces sp. NPDC060028]|uniref:hypothetical protein n=1 Tax=Streptomyces sp. NPDC060028 TaxID=3347041 RepID=UPI0036CC8185
MKFPEYVLDPQVRVLVEERGCLGRARAVTRDRDNPLRMNDMTAALGTSSDAEPGEPAGPAGLGWAPAGPAGMNPRARETIEHIVEADRNGDDAAIRTLLADLAALADTATLLYLRERLHEAH